MAIIPCRECAHQISDRAASCPSCGAPVTRVVTSKPRKRLIPRVLITLMAFWTLGTVLWLAAPSGAYNQLITLAKSSLHRLEPGNGLRPATDQAQVSQSSTAADSKASTFRDTVAASEESNSSPPVAAERTAVRSEPGQSGPPPRSVYRTTAQQLYRDYNANVVAIQTKIGTSRVRVMGNVAEIDQDPAGHPVVRLFTDKDAEAATMTLNEDQRAAAALLVKNEAVEIECDKVGHSGDLLQGHDCSLALVDIKPKQVNLALFLANGKGATNVYIVGPMPEAACLTRADSISSQLHVNQRGEYVVWKGCTDAARENIPPGGCRLHSSPVSIPDIPPAHLWRYDCGSSSAARTFIRKRTGARSPGSATVALDSNTESVTATGLATGSSSGQESGLDPSRESTPVQTFAAPMVASTAVAAPPPEPPTTASATAAAPVSAAIAPATDPAAAHATASNLRLASASDSDTGTAPPRAPVEEVTVAHAPQSANRETIQLQGTSRETTSAPPVTTPDDLSRVRAVDPQAADHIANYCANSVQDTFLADCRRREAEAWTRLVLQKEFPTLDEATRKRCSEPPFPDTYVAKESCARYELHMN